VSSCAQEGCGAKHSVDKRAAKTLELQLEVMRILETGLECNCGEKVPVEVKCL
jgi:hypothetical protein